MGRIRAGLIAVVVLAGVMAITPAGIGHAAPAKGNAVAAYWTPARQKAATPRDLRVDDRGLAYLEQTDGSLAPHGHATKQLRGSAPASKPTPNAKPPKGDTTGPSVTNRVPASSATIGADQTFSATVTDPGGIRSVNVTIKYPNGTTQSFAAAGNGSGTTYSTAISGFTNGSWEWRVVAKDNVGATGNTTTTAYTPFTVNTGGGGGGSGDVVNDPWTGGGTVQTAAGRIYFEMPTNTRLTRWSGYVCSGTVAVDSTTGRSVIITAAHCVYDDVHKAFARNVLFIPNQDGTTGSGTDANCSNDPLGCWTPSFGVVDRNWTTRTFPDNIPWDYAFYVVPDSGAHSGTAAPSNVLDVAAKSLPVQLTDPTLGQAAHALGYSYSDDPNFMYCSEALGTEPDYDDWWLGRCGLSGGASGGPWLQPVNGGAGPIISVNSWGYTNQPGMAGPRLSGTSAGCVFTTAKGQTFAGVTNRGAVADCPLT